MAAILGSDIDKLVLGEYLPFHLLGGDIVEYSWHFFFFFRGVHCVLAGYLRDKNLKKASEVFCKTSPHLREEYELLKRGLTPRSITDFNLIGVLKEYCEIRAIGKLSSNL